MPSSYKAFLVSSLLVFTLFANGAQALAPLLTPKAQTKLKEQNVKFREAAGYSAEGEKTPLDFVATIINTALSLLGVLFLGLIIYGGFRWLNAQGNEEDVTKAKQIITQAVIGLVIVLAAYAISYFVVFTLQKETLNVK